MQSDIHRSYEFQNQRLGEGTFGSVCMAKSKVTGASRAVKGVRKKGIHNLMNFWREVDAMKVMDHPNIIKLYETYEDQFTMYLVMEVCEGGELFHRVVGAGRLTESQSRAMMQQVLRTVVYLHENDIAHRDLKPENYLLVKRGPLEDNVLKLIDFGAACYSPATANHTTMVGTALYMAPQVLFRKYDRRCDYWSCGVILYTMLSGQVPFGGTNTRDIVMTVRRGVYSLAGPHWKEVTDAPKDLLQGLLRKNPEGRLSAAQALKHEWFSPLALGGLASLPRDAVRRMRAFSAAGELGTAATLAVADQLGEAEIQPLREAFLALTATTGYGGLSLETLRHGLERQGLAEAAPDLDEILQGLDVSKTGNIDYTSFLAATMERCSLLQEARCESAFAFFDTDADGRISVADLREALGRFRGQRAAKEFANQGLSYRDFLALLGRGSACMSGHTSDEESTEAASDFPLESMLSSSYSSVSS